MSSFVTDGHYANPFDYAVFPSQLEFIVSSSNNETHMELCQGQKKYPQELQVIFAFRNIVK